jgi:hypothetical protein
MFTLFVWLISDKPVVLSLRTGQLLFLELHSTTHMLTTRTHTHPYEYTYTNPAPMCTSEGLSTGRSGDSRSHHWRLVVNENVVYHLTHNIGKSEINPGKGVSTRI